MNKSYEEFCEYVKENILNYMPDGAERTAGLQMIIKNNNIRLVGLTVEKNGSHTAPTLYLEPYYEEYCLEESSIGKILSEIVDFYLRTESNTALPFDIPELSEDHIIGTLVSTLNNDNFLNNIPYIKVNEDFALIFKYYLPNVSNNGNGTITITDSYAELNALTTEKLLECALKNTPRILPVSLQSIQDTLAELMGISPSELLGEKEIDIPMYILSNTENYMGASALLYPDTRNLLLKKFDSGLILIPSSIHEWIVVPVTGTEDIEDFSAMVQEVNHSSVSPTDVLGERAYFLSRENLSDTTQLLPIFEPAIVRQ